MSELKNYNDFVNKIMLKFIKTGPVLDFGSGFGIFCKFLNTSGFQCHGLEIDKEALSQSKKNKIKTFTDLSEIDILYPVITSLNVLEHIDDDENAIKEITKKMEKDGLLILYVPASMKAWSQMDIDAGHYRRYEKKEIIKKLENNNLKVVHFSFKDCAGWLILVIFRFLKIKPKFNKKLLILYDKLFFPFLKYIDLIGGRFFGKNIFVVAKLSK
tara:strand:- start:360 stop:1001 length:642 start_codon:yes stop_codon:yes gene_type:complete